MVTSSAYSEGREGVAEWGVIPEHTAILVGTQDMLDLK